jgi:hypothetical protein
MSRRALLLAVGLLCATLAADAARPAQLARPVVRTVGARLALRGHVFWPVMWETVSMCPKKSVIDKVASLRVDVAIDVGGGGLCANRTPPAQRASRLHAELRKRLLWYEQNDDARRTLAALPELVDWRAREIYVGRGASLDCGHSTDGFYRALRSRSGNGPVVASIDIAAYSYGKSCLSRSRVRNLFWTAYVAGSSGVALSTIRSPVGRTAVLYEVKGGVETQVRTEASHRRELARCLAGTKTDVHASGGVRVASYRSKRGVCVIAANTGLHRTRSSFRIAGLAGKRLVVLWEGRNAKVDGGRVSEKFAPLGVHLYRAS